MARKKAHKIVECHYCAKPFDKRGLYGHMVGIHPEYFKTSKRRWPHMKPSDWPSVFTVDEEAIIKSWDQLSAEDDPINHPAHYTFGRFEVLDVIEDWFSDDFLLGQVLKYIARAGRKGDALEDLRKAQFYLARRIDKEKHDAE